MKGLLRSIKFLSDENVKLDLIKFLSREGVDVKNAPKGEKDLRLFSLACEDERAILTHDKHFLNKALFPPEKSCGIVVMRIHPPDLSKLQSAVLKLLNEYSAKEIKGKLLVLWESGVEFK